MTIYYKPSIFELIAAESLRHGLREAIRFLADHIRNGEKFRNIPLPQTDELVLLADLLIESVHLKSYNASYAESFYYLSRVYPINQNGLSGLSYQKANLLLSLVRIVMIPYFKAKLDKYFERLHHKHVKTASELNNLRLYRLLTSSCSFLNLIFLLRYAAGTSPYHEFTNKIIRVMLMGRIEEDMFDPSNYSLVEKAIKFTADFLGKLLTIGSIAIQFMDYWNSRNNSAPIFVSSLPTPSAPEAVDFPFANSKYANTCPLCGRLRRNECVLSNTGYVFCYNCIQRHVASKQSCPVTGNPTSEDNIVRLYSVTS